MDIKDYKSLLNADQVFEIPHQNSEEELLNIGKDAVYCDFQGE